jgi:DNA-binding MarR family transcriptional regulator
MLGLLESVEQDGSRSQRRLAAELGIAVGLVNAYLNRCIRKGLVKVSHAPARRYAYYLTPQGFIEKSRLSLEYLSLSFRFFREAKLDCSSVFEAAVARGIARLALNGVSDIAEIATICARECNIEIVAIVDDKTTLERFAGVPIARNYADVTDLIDALIVTDTNSTRATIEAAVAHFGAPRVLVPNLLLRVSGHSEVVS